jgi:PIN domain nuclease of toxin-antitoxin system
MLLLDTSVLLWLAADQSRLSERARGLIAAHAGELCVSAISAFEIGIKHRKSSLLLPQEPESWFGAALQLHGLLEVPVDWRIAERSTSLPRLHGDPCDRMLIATAQLRGLTLLSPDPLLLAYPDVRIDW